MGHLIWYLSGNVSHHSSTHHAAFLTFHTVLSCEYLYMCNEKKTSRWQGYNPTKFDLKVFKDLYQYSCRFKSVSVTTFCHKGLICCRFDYRHVKRWSGRWKIISNCWKDTCLFESSDASLCSSVSRSGGGWLANVPVSSLAKSLLHQSCLLTQPQWRTHLHCSLLTSRASRYLDCTHARPTITLFSPSPPCSARPRACRQHTAPLTVAAVDREDDGKKRKTDRWSSCIVITIQER